MFLIPHLVSRNAQKSVPEDFIVLKLPRKGHLLKILDLSESFKRVRLTSLHRNTENF